MSTLRRAEIAALQTGRCLIASGYYRQFLDKRFRNFTLAGLVTDDEPILLRQIYVPLVLGTDRFFGHDDRWSAQSPGRDVAEWFEAALSSDSPEDGEDERRERFRCPRLFFVSGEAGSGKTTLTSAIVASLAGTVSDDFNRRFGGYLPFPILLRDAPVDRIESLDELVFWWLEQAKAEQPALNVNDVVAFLEHGRGIMLLDGLDELGTLERRLRVLRWFREHRWLESTDAGGANLAVVTARPSGFDGTRHERILSRTRELYILPFSSQQVRMFLTRWFALRPMPSARRTEHVDALVERLEREPRMSQLRQLAQRPAYLASLAFVHGTRGALPHTRAALYDAVIDAYIDTLDRQRGLDRLRLQAGLRNWDRQEKREVLASVAWQAHVGATQGHNPTMRYAHGDRRFAWTRAELEMAVERAIQQGRARFRTIAPSDAKEMTEYFVARTGLLVETREGTYQFGHLSFQEYLTALCALDRASGTDRKADAIEKLLLDRLKIIGWQEVVLLALAVDATRTQGTGHRAVLAKLDLTKDEHVALLGALLAGEELPLQPHERKAWVIAWIPRWLGLHKRWGRGPGHDVLTLAANREGVEATWCAVCEAISARQNPGAAIRALVAELETLEQNSDAVDFMDVLVGSDPLSVPRDWVARTPDMNERLAIAEILLAPVYARAVPDGAKAMLGDVAKQVVLFEGEGSEASGLQPTPYWGVLNEWGGRFPELLQMGAERIPLAPLCFDRLALWPAMLIARWGRFDDDALRCWRQERWRDWLSVERALCSIVLASLDVDSTTGYKERRLLLRVPGVSCVDVWQDRRYERPGTPVGGVAGDSSGRWFLLAELRSIEYAWVDSARDSVRLVRPNRRSVLRLVRLLQMDSTTVRKLLGAWQNTSVGSVKTWRRRAKTAMLAWLTGVAFFRILDGSSDRIRRVDVERWRSSMGDPELVLQGLEGAVREQALSEWTQLVRSPISPAPWLDAVLARDWDTIDVSRNAFCERFERVAARLLQEIAADSSNGNT